MYWRCISSICPTKKGPKTRDVFTIFVSLGSNGCRLIACRWGVYTSKLEILAAELLATRPRREARIYLPRWTVGLLVGCCIVSPLSEMWPKIKPLFSEGGTLTGGGRLTRYEYSWCMMMFLLFTCREGVNSCTGVLFLTVVGWLVAGDSWYSSFLEILSGTCLASILMFDDLMMNHMFKMVWNHQILMDDSRILEILL